MKDLITKEALITKEEAIRPTSPDLTRVFGGTKGFNLAVQSTPGNRLQSGATDTSQIADGSVTAAKLASNAVTNAKVADDVIKQAEWDYEQVSVTVSAASSTGTATVTSGSIVIGWRPTGNQDQFIDNISVSGTTLTITLGAAATADNTFQVTLLKS